jgi:hypothetical protein
MANTGSQLAGKNCKRKISTNLIIIFFHTILKNIPILSRLISYAKKNTY